MYEFVLIWTRYIRYIGWEFLSFPKEIIKEKQLNIKFILSYIFLFENLPTGKEIQKSKINNFLLNEPQCSDYSWHKKFIVVNVRWISIQLTVEFKIFKEINNRKPNWHTVFKILVTWKQKNVIITNCSKRKIPNLTAEISYLVSTLTSTRNGPRLISLVLVFCTKYENRTSFFQFRFHLGLY